MPTLADPPVRKPKGGAMTPHPPEKLELAKAEYLAGKPWTEIASVVGIHVDVLRHIACNHKWTAMKAELKAKQKAEELRPKLASHLNTILDAPELSKTDLDAKGKKKLAIIQTQADAVMTLTNAAEKVEDWARASTSSVMSVLAVSNGTTPDERIECSPGPAQLESTLDAEIVPPPDSYEI